jgi:hypothetical protein
MAQGPTRMPPPPRPVARPPQARPAAPPPHRTAPAAPPQRATPAAPPPPPVTAALALSSPPPTPKKPAKAGTLAIEPMQAPPGTPPIDLKRLPPIVQVPSVMEMSVNALGFAVPGNEMWSPDVKVMISRLMPPVTNSKHTPLTEKE